MSGDNQTPVTSEQTTESNGGLYIEPELLQSLGVEGAQNLPEQTSANTEQTLNVDAQQGDVKPKPTENKVDEWSKGFAALSRKERKNLEWEQRLKGNQEAIDAYNNLSKEAKDNPVAILEHFGVSIDDVINHHLDTHNNKQNPVEAEIKQLKETIQKLEEKEGNREKESVKQQQDQVKTQVTNACESFLGDNSETYPYLSRKPESERGADLFTVAQHIYDETGKIPTEADVCEVLNSIYEDQVKPYQDLFKPKENTEQARVTENQTQNNQGMPGVSTINQNNATRQTAAHNPNQPIDYSEDARIAAAAAAIADLA